MRILDGVERSPLVVVIFNNNISTWVHFEASCAYFEKKLFPVSLNDAEVPLPYARVHYHTIRFDAETGTVDEESLDRLVEAVAYKLDGAKQHVGRTRMYRRLNHFFFRGFTVMFAVISAVILFGIDLNSLTKHANHLHVRLGSVIIGGQFFLSLGFARTVAYPSSRQREYGFRIAERLYFTWAILTVIQPMLGLLGHLDTAIREGLPCTTIYRPPLSIFLFNLYTLAPTLSENATSQWALMGFFRMSSQP